MPPAQAVTADLAAIESAKADIAAQKATVENMQIQFGYTEINSPVDGRTGNIRSSKATCSARTPWS